MKRSIGTKIILIYMLLFVVSLGILGVLFSSLINNELIREVQNSLQKEGTVLVKLLKKVPLEQMKQEPSAKKRNFKLVNRLFEGNYFVVDQSNQVVFINQPGVVEAGSIITVIPLGKSFKGQIVRGVYPLKDRDVVTVGLPLKDQSENIKGVLVIFTELKGVRKLSSSILILLLRTLMVVGSLTVVIGIFLARSISKPIRLLEAGARRLGEKEFATRIKINTGDELESLSHSFNTMAQELQSYYAAQKRFIQNASHELKTPLMSIQGYAEGIKDGILNGEEKDKGLEIIIEESKRLKNLVNELTYLSKLETMEEVYDFAQNDLGQVLWDSYQKVVNLANQNHVKIVIDKPHEPMVINMDSEKMTRAFINLFSNGIKFAHSRVDVLLKQNKGRIVLEFNDDGPGFREDEIASVFDRFYIGHKGDTGLGLAITKAIVEKHRGKITAHNRETGACIIAVFPK